MSPPLSEDPSVFGYICFLMEDIAVLFITYNCCRCVAYQICFCQILSTRARKNVVMNEIKVNVCIYAFDILYLDGQLLLQEQLNVRREVWCLVCFSFCLLIILMLPIILFLTVHEQLDEFWGILELLVVLCLYFFG